MALESKQSAHQELVPASQTSKAALKDYIDKKIEGLASAQQESVSAENILSEVRTIIDQKFQQLDSGVRKPSANHDDGISEQLSAIEASLDQRISMIEAKMVPRPGQEISSQGSDNGNGSESGLGELHDQFAQLQSKFAEFDNRSSSQAAQITDLRADLTLGIRHLMANIKMNENKINRTLVGREEDEFHGHGGRSGHSTVDLVGSEASGNASIIDIPESENKMGIEQGNRYLRLH